MKTLEKCAFSTCLAGARGAGGYCEYHADRILSSNEEVNPETNRDKVLHGETVQVSDGRLQEMQRIAVMREGVGLGDLHWHWAAVVNELIERRARLQNETEGSRLEGVRGWRDFWGKHIPLTALRVLDGIISPPVNTRAGKETA